MSRITSSPVPETPLRGQLITSEDINRTVPKNLEGVGIEEIGRILPQLDTTSGMAASSPGTSTFFFFFSIY